MSDLVTLEPTVLLIDDEPAVARAHARLLERSGVRVDTCLSATTALRRLSDGERFDAVVCDVQMPELRGIELFRRVRLLWPELKERIIFLSGGLHEEDAHFIRDHALRFLPKPLRRIDDLGDAVRELVARVGRHPREKA